MKIGSLHTPSSEIKSVISGISSSSTSKVGTVDFENFSKKFSNSSPELLFISEYFVDDKSVGVLLVWERFFDATHYEIFKKNLFQEDAKFERVLFLDSKNLEEESKNYFDYLRNVIGLNIKEDKVFVFLDTTIKEDRIYEYKIKAARVPEKFSEVDYDFILESKNLTKQIVIDQNSNNTVFDLSGIVYGSSDLAWSVALLDESVVFFGKNGLEKTVVSYTLAVNDDNEEYVLVANDINDILLIMRDSFSLFSVRDTFKHFLDSLGGLGFDFKDLFISSIDEIKNVFSYDNFKENIKIKIPTFNVILQLSQTNNKNAINELSKLSIIIPSESGSESFSSLEGLTKILKFVNNFFISVLYAQDNSAKVQEILKNIDTGNKDVVENISSSSSANISTTSQNNSSNVVSGPTKTKQTTKARVV